MNMSERAVEILRHAENSLRSLVAEAAASGDYKRVFQLASWAQAVADLVRTPTSGESGTLTKSEPSIQTFGVEERHSSKRQSARIVTRRGDSRKAYPRFFHKGDQLIKVGWSKREKQEYQHRASLTVLKALASALAKIGADGRLFSTDEFVPLKNPTENTEIPTYQVYVCLALLKQSGLVDQHGRQGYSIPQVPEFSQAVENAWRKLPEQ